MNTKEFIATWTANGYVHPKREVVDSRFFYDDNGYDDAIRSAIDALIVGEIMVVDIGHSLRRVR